MQPLLSKHSINCVLDSGHLHVGPKTRMCVRFLIVHGSRALAVLMSWGGSHVPSSQAPSTGRPLQT